MDSVLELNSDKLSRVLEADDYIMERLHPRRNTSFYLHLVDLREAIDLFATSQGIRILDYGCGGSPYRSLFPNSDYVRADFTPCKGLDFLLPSDSSIPVPDSSFDMVLSTQVLEHVQEPSHYIAECFRVLKPRGFLVLTTHGLFEDHGCPFDFQRWTADGLRLLLQRTGFYVKQTKKLTCGPRALCFFINQGFRHLRGPTSSLFGLATWGLRGLWRLNPSWLNHCAEKYYKEFNIVDAETPNNRTYIALLVHAERPALDCSITPQRQNHPNYTT
jgi:SAM-dependent methyltransferase